MLLSRVADSLYWGARYIERAEDTARIVRSYTDVMVDLPTSVGATWTPLLAIAGSREEFEAVHDSTDEREIVRFLVADESNPGSVVGSITTGRNNLRATREVLPREAWQAVNDLYLYTSSNRESGVDRRSRARFLTRIIEEGQRIDGVLTAAMSRDEAYEFWRMGEALERADMTTRVLGVRASALLDPGVSGDSESVQWMGVLRSLSALQMYQRATRGSIDGVDVVEFLLHDHRFPRSVSSCLNRVGEALGRLPRAEAPFEALAAAVAVREGIVVDEVDGAALDDAMDRMQVALDMVHASISATYLDVTHD
jgi:uncharacterized alpha-E superfamily protein